MFVELLLNALMIWTEPDYTKKRPYRKVFIYSVIVFAVFIVFAFFDSLFFPSKVYKEYYWLGVVLIGFAISFFLFIISSLAIFFKKRKKSKLKDNN